MRFFAAWQDACDWYLSIGVASGSHLHINSSVGYYFGRNIMGIYKNCFAWGCALAAVMPFGAYAADTAAPSTELESITVTAEKRSESEQTVPLSMTTFSSAALEQK